MKTTAQTIQFNYRGHLGMMLAEAKVWGEKEPVMAFEGYNEYPIYTFQDGSQIEFKVRHGFAHEVRIIK